jgi:hypothetical protein
VQSQAFRPLCQPSSVALPDGPVLETLKPPAPEAPPPARSSAPTAPTPSHRPGRRECPGPRYPVANTQASSASNLGNRPTNFASPHRSAPRRTEWTISPPWLISAAVRSTLQLRRIRHAPRPAPGRESGCPRPAIGALHAGQDGGRQMRIAPRGAAHLPPIRSVQDARQRRAAALRRRRHQCLLPPPVSTAHTSWLAQPMLHAIEPQCLTFSRLADDVALPSAGTDRCPTRRGR